MSTETKAIAKINNVSILVNQDAEKRVAIKPICEILEIDYSRQLKKLKEDAIVSSNMGVSPTVAQDGKIREMQTIPLKYVFGWLFTINDKNVKEDSRDFLINYKRECYDALYNYFSSKAEFVETRQNQIEKQLDILRLAKDNFKNANKVLKEAEGELTKIRKYTFEDFQAEKQQLKIDL